MSHKILFIGTFLSSKKGTVSPSEKLAFLLQKEGLETIAVSRRANKFFRIVEIVINILVKRYTVAHLDVFSGLAFRISEISLYFLKLRGKKVILNLHGGKLKEFYLRYPQRVGRVLNCADTVISPSLYLIEFFQGKNFKVQYLPNFLVFAHFPFFSPDKRLPNTILWVRAFSEIYNPTLAIRMLNYLKNTFPDIKLVMIGPNDGLLSEVVHLIDQLDLKDNVVIKGPIDNELLGQEYGKHSVYINTTSYESFGVSVLEAAASGIPIVSTKVGELPYIWEDEREILFIDGKDPEDMAAQITRILSDSELRLVLTTNAYQRSLEFSWPSLRERWLDLLLKN